MTEHPASRFVEVVSLRADPGYVVLKAQKRQLADALEPGFALDPNTGKVHRARPPRRRAWLEFTR